MCFVVVFSGFFFFLACSPATGTSYRVLIGFFDHVLYSIRVSLLVVATGDMSVISFSRCFDRLLLLMFFDFWLLLHCVAGLLRNCRSRFVLILLLSFLPLFSG